MKRVLILLLSLAALLAARADSAWAQGGLSGLVRTDTTGAGESLVGVTVRVNLLTQASITGYGAQTVSTAQGFVFTDLPPGVYTVIAAVIGEGFSTDVVEVLNANTTVVDLLLGQGLGTGPVQPTVLVEGMVLVEQDSLTGFTQYLLGVGVDSAPAYRLLLGPASYVPVDSAVVRPRHGEAALIGGRLFSYSEPPMIVVNTINHYVWRDIFDPGHGGTGNGLYSGLQCDPTLVRVELTGTIEDQLAVDSSMYSLGGTLDSISYILDFGSEQFHRPNTPARPVDNDALHIVGGWTDCAGSPQPRILVYEINGQLWRVPGDTWGLESLVSTSLEPAAPPVSYLTAANYPNPFNAQTTIRFNLPATGYTRLTIYDLTGREVDRLQDGILPAGVYTRTWDGAARASGIYFYAVELERERFVGRMVLLK